MLVIALQSKKIQTSGRAPFSLPGGEGGALPGKLDPRVCTLKKGNRALEGDFCQNCQTQFLAIETS